MSSKESVSSSLDADAHRSYNDYGVVPTITYTCADTPTWQQMELPFEFWWSMEQRFLEWERQLWQSPVHRAFIRSRYAGETLMWIGYISGRPVEQVCRTL